MTRLILITAAALLLPLSSSADQVRRGASESSARRGGIADDRSGRRPIEGKGNGGGSTTRADEQRKQTTRVVRVTTPSRCGARNASSFRSLLLGLKNPSSEDFYIEVWGNERVFYEYDPVYYFLRSNRDAYVTMFWIGPEGSVFVPFMNFKVEADRDHKLDPSNIIVQPVGFERWRVIATEQPHSLPCRTTDAGWVSAIRAIQSSVRWAAGHWDVQSKVRKRRRLRRRRRR